MEFLYRVYDIEQHLWHPVSGVQCAVSYHIGVQSTQANGLPYPIQGEEEPPLLAQG